jgi:cell division septum initiation protein DivIVA
MDKQNELAILQKTAEELGPDSYCGPWLLSILPQIVADMLDGLPPAPTMYASRELSISLLVNARYEAEQIITKAKAEAAQILEHARNPLQRRRNAQGGKNYTADRTRIAAQTAPVHVLAP